MQWWCSAQGTAWSWKWQPYPGVWLALLLLAHFYFRVLRRAPSGAGAAGPDSSWRLAAGVGGFIALWLALDWPLGALGAGYLASVHMVQYLLIALIAPPLLLSGITADGYAALQRRPRLFPIVRGLTHPAAALAGFILVAIATHMPSVLDGLMQSQLGSFVIDLAWFVTGLFFWWPIIAPTPERPGFPPPLQLVYMFPATLAHTAISVYLVFSKFPVYATYELAPPTGWISALADQQIAGGLMWVVATPIMWGISGTVLLRWMRDQSAAEEPSFAAS